MNAVAFVMWNLTARSPLRVARDIVAAFAAPPLLLAGAVRAVVGGVLLAGSALLVLSLAARGRDFALLETLAVLAALSVDQLVGPELRRVLFHRPE